MEVPERMAAGRHRYVVGEGGEKDVTLKLMVEIRISREEIYSHEARNDADAIVQVNHQTPANC